MKYYETHFEEYTDIISKHLKNAIVDDTDVRLYNEITKMFPEKVKDLGNVILYGPAGSGKYSFALYLIQKYSSSKLKYDKKIKLQSDKLCFNYRISDIHYEIDFQLLGCSSKTIWHELFLQIIDIISVKTEKIGIILCKNFYSVNNELLDIFYSYIQEYNHPYSNIQIKFFFIMENISFLPNNILNSCRIIGLKSKTGFIHGGGDIYLKSNIRKSFGGRDGGLHKMRFGDIVDKKTNNSAYLNKGAGDGDITQSTLQIICNNIIQDIYKFKNVSCGGGDNNFVEFREHIYDILVYNLDVFECIWFVIAEFKGQLCDDFFNKHLFVFFQQYNNNYRPIYHLENIFLKMV